MKKPIRFSVKSLSKRIDCTPEGRKHCQGKCCTGGIFNLDELWRIPKNLHARIELKKDMKFYTVPYPAPNKQCPLYEECMNNYTIKPDFCRLYPIIINKNGTMTLSRWIYLGHCPNYGRGEEVWISLKDNIIDVLGQDTFDRIEEVMTRKIRPLTEVFG